MKKHKQKYVGQDDVPNDYEKISYMRDSYIDIIQRYHGIGLNPHIFPIVCKNKGSNKMFDSNELISSDFVYIHFKSLCHASYLNIWLHLEIRLRLIYTIKILFSNKKCVTGNQ